MHPRGTRSAGVGAAVALHALACAALLSYEPARSALLAAAPIMVDLLTPPKVEPKIQPPVEIIPPKPRPAKKKPVAQPPPRPPEPLPVMTAPMEAPSPVVVAPPPEAPPPPPVEIAPPQPAPPEPAPPPPVVVIPPIFAADYLDNPAPPYPALSRRNGEQGRVLLRVLVNPAGAADEVEIRASSGFARLDQAARETVLRWRFVPAKRGHVPVPAWVLIPISFRLEG